MDVKARSLFLELEMMQDTLRSQIQSAHENAEGNVTRFTYPSSNPQLELDIPKLRQAVRDQVVKLQDPLLESTEQMVDRSSVLMLIEEIEKNVKRCRNDAARYNRYQETLHVAQSAFDDVEDLTRQLDDYARFWRGVEDWERDSARWIGCAFCSIDVEQLIAGFHRIASVSAKLLAKTHPCVPIFLEKVLQFKNLLPVVSALRNPALRKRHWDPIMRLLGEELPLEDPEFTLGMALDRRIQDHLEALSEISSRATAEAGLEEQLQKVKKLWADKELIILPYKESKDVFILGDLEDVSACLEDSLVTVSTLAGSRFVQPIKEEVEYWQRSLLYFQDTLLWTTLLFYLSCLTFDEWATLQRNWIYLEAIFGAADIKKQLPTESGKFAEIDAQWKIIMRETCEGNLVMIPERLELFRKWNHGLDMIQKSLEDYLQSKRLHFPRFFFLSNEELLEILAQSRRIEAVQPHLRKCFDGLHTLKFANVDRHSAEILAMQSVEGEEVWFYRSLKARSGSLETKQKIVDKKTNLNEKIRESKKRSLYTRARWVLEKHAQVVTTVDLIVWCQAERERLQAKQEFHVGLLDRWLRIQMMQLAELTDLVCTFELSPLQRKSIVKVRINVHCRDIVESLVQGRVTSASSFKWQQQLRFYWGDIVDEVHVRQVEAHLRYGYEYIGCTSRLVVTPLTDRCWLTITGAMHIKLGANPSGPAGTGKTESCKDLAKGLARQCVVFNCSEQIDYKMMAKLYSGVCACGAWTCLDEFNRISIEVLSVIAQQLICIRQALLSGATEFMFENCMLRLKHTAGVCITMNPGYAGRTELPDNLKMLFRPVAMMVPDYTLIAEIMLFAEGFQAAKRLSGKFTNLFKLSSEQLSQQDHYDFGMRAVKSVLVMAGTLLKRAKREQQQEDIILIRAMRDANVPKFLADDLPLFEAIVRDLFPGIDVPPVEQSRLKKAVEIATKVDLGLQVVSTQVEKVIQLYETTNVRFGVTLVGKTLGGKTVCYRTLAKALGRPPRPSDSHSLTHNCLNPKCISMGELYGQFSALTQEWTDGLGSSLIRAAADDTDEEKQHWVVFDGPIDALWIENMNTVLDDSMMLCLASGERIKLHMRMRMLFEVQDLAQASPATVSRLGMVYLTASVLGWRPYVKTWLRTKLNPTRFTQRHKEVIYGLFDKHVDEALRYLRTPGNGCVEPMTSEDTQLVMALCGIFSALLDNAHSQSAHAGRNASKRRASGATQRRGSTDENGGFYSNGEPVHSFLQKLDNRQFELWLTPIFAFSLAWSIGGTVTDPKARASLHVHLSKEFEQFTTRQCPTLDSGFFDLRGSSWQLLPAFNGSQQGGQIEDTGSGSPAGGTSSAGGNTNSSGGAVGFIGGDGSGSNGEIEGQAHSPSATTQSGRRFAPPLVSWDELAPSFAYKTGTDYFDLLVPTQDTVRYSFLLDKLISANASAFLSGDAGVGKSVLLQRLLLNMKRHCDVAPVFVIFSAQTSAERTQNTIESKLEKKRKNVLSSPVGKRVVILVDDVNMPAPDTYGSQPPIELLRQFQDFRGFYDRQKLFWKEIENTLLLFSSAPPGGGRKALSPRFTRHSHPLAMPPTSAAAMQQIFGSILSGFLLTFKQEIQIQASACVLSTIEMFAEVCENLLPTPSKPQYTFNLRDVSRVFQGILCVKALHCTNKETFQKLWIHEMSRVFHDRLNSAQDQTWFFQKVSRVLKVKYRADQWTIEVLRSDAMAPWGNFMRMGAVGGGGGGGGGSQHVGGSYEEMKDTKKLVKMLEQVNADFNSTNTPMSLVFFKDAISHVTRIARVLSQPRGSLLLVGVGGSGRQSLTRFFREQKKTFLLNRKRNYRGPLPLKPDAPAGGPDGNPNTGSSDSNLEQSGTPTCFLLNDTQILQESFLEDVNSLLNAGEVPNLLSAEQTEDLIQTLRPHCLAHYSGGMIDAITREDVYLPLITRVRYNLHVVLAMSPVGEMLRVRLRMFPSLINCTTVNWFFPWPAEALFSVAEHLLQSSNHLENNKAELSGGPRLDTSSPPPSAEILPSQITAICSACVVVHESVQAQAENFLHVLQRHVYVTPKSFLDLLQGYQELLGEKQQHLRKSQRRLKVGIDECLELIPVVREEQKKATSFQKVVERDAEVVSKQQQLWLEGTTLLKKELEYDLDPVEERTSRMYISSSEASHDLSQAMPAFHAAVKALDALDKKDITEIRTFVKPPPLVMLTMEAVCVLLGEKTDWDSAKRVMQDNNAFIARLKDFDKDKIPQNLLKKLESYVKKPEYAPENVGNQSRACRSLCMWTHAIHTYSIVAKEVEPKKLKLAELNDELKKANKALATKQAELDKVLKEVNALRQKLEDTEKEKESLIAESALTEKRLERADVLTNSLAQEDQRWRESVEKMAGETENLVGDVFLAAACISYYGPFTGSYETKISYHYPQWHQALVELAVPCMNSAIGSYQFSLEAIMGDVREIREWSRCELPADSVSVCNGILVTRGKRWPLMIDPQGQANKWMRKRANGMNGPAGFKVIKASHPKLLTLLESCVRNGYELLVEDAGESLDPALEPILSKAYFQAAGGTGRVQIRLGDQDVDYDLNFRISFTTKLANPHYLPDLSIKVLIVNFTVTPQGLEEQLLNVVVTEETPEVMERKTDLHICLIEDKEQLEKLEKLRLLTDSEGNILDDVALITALQESKKTSTEIEHRVELAEKTQQEIQRELDFYRPLAVRGSLLYFSVADLALIDPMYQFSLLYFQKLFIESIVLGKMPTTNAARGTASRLSKLIHRVSKKVFVSVSRGLFERHKTTFSFCLAAQIHRREGHLANDAWFLFLTGEAASSSSSSGTGASDLHIVDSASTASGRGTRNTSGAANTSGRKLSSTSGMSSSNPVPHKPEFLNQKQWDMMQRIARVCRLPQLLLRLPQI
ncbi:unnamed protein product, partial [Amoebophrya sp. A25]|eukprot:GSA25T00020785001.1